MQIVIPMSGLGSRFIEAGYTDIKPLIRVHGKPIIEYVVSLFPGETDFIFICRKEHLESTLLESELKRICPTGKIVAIESHKLGPVYAVSKAYSFIDDSLPVIVNYCDFFMLWNYSDFKEKMEKFGYEGAIPSYTGFHPHLIYEKNLYASCKVDGDMNLLEIKEKYSFEKDKTKAYHSAGTYYFKNGEILKKYFEMAMVMNQSLNNEFYVSLVYNNMVNDGLKINVYDEIDKFCQWGTPEDLSEYNYWSEIFNTKKSK